MIFVARLVFSLGHALWISSIFVAVEALGGRRFMREKEPELLTTAVWMFVLGVALVAAVLVLAASIEKARAGK